MMALLVAGSADTCNHHEEAVSLLQSEFQLVRNSPPKPELVGDGEDDKIEGLDNLYGLRRVVTDHVKESTAAAPPAAALPTPVSSLPTPALALPSPAIPAPVSSLPSPALPTPALPTTNYQHQSRDLAECTFSQVLWRAAAMSVCFAIAWLVTVRMWVALRRPQEHTGSNLSDEASDERIVFIDNAKFVALTFVVFFHVLCTSQPLGAAAWQFVMFNIRIFCFLSGLVAKDALNASKFLKLIIRLGVPYLFYSVLVDPLTTKIQFPMLRMGSYAANDLGSYVADNLSLLHDHIGWYLLALVAWRLGGSLLHPLQPYVGMRFGVAMAFSIAGNYCVQAHRSALPLQSSNFLNRTASLFPVFVAGQMFPLKWLSELPTVGGTSVILGCILLASCFYVQSSQMFMGFSSQIPMYGEMVIPGNNFLESSCGKLELLLWIPCLFRNIFELSKGLVILLCFCPRSTCIISEWGENSMYPYLLHRTMIFHGWMYIQPPAAFSTWALLGLGLMIYSVFCTAILATRPVRMIFGVLVEPSWLEKLLGLQKAA
jgi:fucose 4-O-acetylase-like acetyltransferase